MPRRQGWDNLRYMKMDEKNKTDAIETKTKETEEYTGPFKRFR